jgi:hypothetical protein
MSVNDRKTYAANWLLTHEDMIVSQLGSKTDCLKFVNGVFFAPCFATATVPHLQRVFMADACHLNFGKYTLFSCYGKTANANMSPVAFAIIFGNENGASWKLFWNCVNILHPTINAPDITIITDQDKGQKIALSEILGQVGHFHCSHHRRGNIIKNCGGGSGKTKYSALWCYNGMVNCRTVGQLIAFRSKHFDYMTDKDRSYLTSLPQESQYPAARCAMGPNIYMYHLQASSGAEVMNHANYSMRQRTAVDLVNAMMLLIELELKRYRKQQEKAWSFEGVFSPRGQSEFEETYKELNHRQFRITVTEMENDWKCQVKRIEDTGLEHTVIIPKVSINDSYFGKCTCGVDKRDGIPCEHMAVVAVSSRVPNVTRHNIMPYWWARKHCWGTAPYGGRLFKHTLIILKSLVD